MKSGGLLRVLGLGFGLAVTVGGTVGVGILRTPGMVASHLGSAGPFLFIWILGGIYALFGTVAVSELGTMMPRAGGWYVYARRAFGDYAGFLIGWCDWIAQSAALAYLASAIGEFAIALFPETPGGIKLVAASTLVLFTALQWMGIRSGSAAQKWTSIAKAVALLIFVALCFIYGKNPAGIQLTSHSVSFIGIVIAMQSVIITYDGWYTPIYFAEEDENPSRNLPRSAIGGILCTIVIYLLINLALMHALSMQELASSQFPAAKVAETIFGDAGGKIITALSLISLLSVVNAVLLLATRILFGLGRDGLFTQKTAFVSQAGTPVPAMLFTSTAAILLTVSGTFEELLAIASVFNVVVYASGFLALFQLRKREPDLPRPFSAWGYPWTTAIALVGSVAFLVGNGISDPLHAAIAGGLIAMSYPLYKTLNL